MLERELGGSMGECGAMAGRESTPGACGFGGRRQGHLGPAVLEAGPQLHTCSS